MARGLTVCSELLSLIDLSAGTLYALNTTSLAEARVLVKGSIDGLSSLRHDYKEVSRVVSEMLLEDGKMRPSARALEATFSKMLSLIRKRGWLRIWLHLIVELCLPSDRTIRPLIVDMAKTSAEHVVVQFPHRVPAGEMCEVKIASYDMMGRPRAKGGDRFRFKLALTFPGGEFNMYETEGIYIAHH